MKVYHILLTDILNIFYYLLHLMLIPQPTVGGLWSDGKGCAMCNYDDNCGG